MQATCPQCSHNHKKLKLIKSDYEFELRKIQQDKSTQKALYEIHLQKQLRKWQEMYGKQRTNREDENKQWLDKYDKTVSNYEIKICKLVENLQREAQIKIQTEQSECETKIKLLTERYEQQIKIVIEKSATELSQQIKSYDGQILKLINENQIYVQNLKKAHKKVIEEQTKAFQSRLLGSESERMIQKKLHQETKCLSKQAQSRLYEQISGLKKTIKQVEVKLQISCQANEIKCEEIKNMKQEIDKIKQEHIIEIEHIKLSNQENLAEHKKQYKFKLLSHFNEAVQQCNQYKMVIDKIQQTRSNQRLVYQNTIKEINSFVDNRASRPEDIQEIEHLKVNFLKKVKQCDSLSEELKFFRLELENKEETYNKIFVSNGNPSNELIINKRKEFKLRRQGKSVTTVREALQTINSANNLHLDKKIMTLKSKVL